mmetsp:Transcript_2117/g.6107  ORF Transcript_2117/g.6107 Transcript_2117/m.6107 type:complete len:288 (+) Transcript_2117:64-927(+)
MNLHLLLLLLLSLPLISACNRCCFFASRFFFLIRLFFPPRSLIFSFLAFFRSVVSFFSFAVSVSAVRLSSSAWPDRVFRKCSCSVANGLALKDGCSSTRFICATSRPARFFFARLVLHGTGCGAATDSGVPSLPLFLSVAPRLCEEMSASRRASSPSSLPLCSSCLFSLSDAMTIFSLLRYCSRLARRLRCPRLSACLLLASLPAAVTLVSAAVVAAVVASPLVSFLLAVAPSFVVETAASSFAFSLRSGACFTSLPEAVRKRPTLLTFGMVVAAKCGGADRMDDGA